VTLWTCIRKAPVRILAGLSFSSVVRYFQANSGKEARTFACQILTYSPFIIIFPTDMMLYALCKIWGLHGSEDWSPGLLDRDIVWLGRWRQHNPPKHM